jgi:hypothetical protein
MRLFSQLVLFSGIVALCLLKWAHPELILQNRISFLPADLDRGAAMEKERKAVERDVISVRKIVGAYRCESAIPIRAV